ncbi:MAG: hypothetical protein EP332_08745 [Bacteroidetes bacterium]|nr:MAG: hypothetical protein EP332_08745 [Bacteroidota bacterium]
MKSFKLFFTSVLSIAICFAFVSSAPSEKVKIDPIFIGQKNVFSFFVPKDAYSKFTKSENEVQIRCESGEVASIVFNTPAGWPGSSVEKHKNLLKAANQSTTGKITESTTVTGVPFQYSETAMDWNGKKIHITMASYFHNDLGVSITYSQLNLDTNARNRVINSFHWGVQHDKLYNRTITHSYAYLVDSVSKSIKGNCQIDPLKDNSFCPEFTIKELKYPDFELLLTDSAINSVKRKNSPILFEHISEPTVGNGYIMLTPAKNGSDKEYFVEMGFYTNSIYHAFTPQKDLKFQFYKMRFKVTIDTPRKELIAKAAGGKWESLSLPFSIADYNLTWFKTMMGVYVRDGW